MCSTARSHPTCLQPAGLEDKLWNELNMQVELCRNDSCHWSSPAVMVRTFLGATSRPWRMETWMLQRASFACGGPADIQRCSSRRCETVRGRRGVAPGALIRVVTGLSKLLASMMGGVSKAWVREATACSSAQL